MALGLFDLFKKKSPEELFFEAVKAGDAMETVKLGEELLRQRPNDLSILNPYIDALIRLGKKEDAVKLLLSFAEERIKEDYYDVAIPILKRILKIDPLNLKAIKLLANTYKKKELFYEAFNTLVESYRRFKESGIRADSIKELIEDFIKEQFHPLFYERYADLLMEEKDTENALVNYVLAANLYLKLGNYKSALRTLLKAEQIRKNESLDRQVVEALAHIDDPKLIKDLLPPLLQNYKNNEEFLKFVVSVFSEADRLPLLKQIVKELQAPKVKYTLLALINFELGEVEEAQEYLEKLKLVDRDLYEKIAATVKSKYQEVLEGIEFPEEVEELPEPEQVLEVLEQVLDLNDIVSEYVEKIGEEEKPSEIKQEIETLKTFEKDGRKALSTAEALLGLGKFDEAIEAAKAALNTENAFKATALIAEAMIGKGELTDALSFLLEVIKNSSLTPEEKARLKVLIGDIHKIKGELNKALMWYREAQKVLNDPEVQEKIEEIEGSEQAV